MKNHEDYSAFPMVYSENDFAIQGLTKLEYAAIHIAAGMIASQGWSIGSVPGYAISAAKQIFKQLEDDNTPVVSDTEL